MSKRRNVVENDKIIQDLAIYEVSRGNTKRIEEEDLDKIRARFSEYKSLLMRGEFTLLELEDRIFDKYGITEPLADAMYLKDIQKEVLGILNKSRPKEQKVKEEAVTPYPLHQRIRDRIVLFLARFGVNI